MIDINSPPPGWSYDADRLRLHQRALDLQARSRGRLDYLAAVALAEKTIGRDSQPPAPTPAKVAPDSARTEFALAPRKRSMYVRIAGGLANLT